MVTIPPSSNVDSSSSSQAPPTPVRAAIHEAAVNWAKKAGVLGADTSEKALSAKLVAAGLGTSIILHYSKEEGYVFKKQSLVDRIINWFTKPLDVIVAGHQKAWEVTGRQTHIEAFKALQAFQELGKRADFTKSDFDREQKAQIAPNQAKQAEAAKIQVERRAGRLDAKGFVGKLSNKVVQLDKQLVLCKSAINAVEIERRDFQEELDVDSFRLRKLQAEGRKIEEDVGGNESQIKSLEESNEKVSADISKNREDLSILTVDLKEANASLSGKIFGRTSIKAKIDDLKSKIEELGEKIISDRELIKSNSAKIGKIKINLKGPLGGALNVKNAEIAAQQKVVDSKEKVIDKFSDKIAVLKTDAARITLLRDKHAQVHDKLAPAIDSNNPHSIKVAFERAQRDLPDIDTPLPTPDFIEVEEKRYGEFLEPEDAGIAKPAKTEKPALPVGENVPKPVLSPYQQRQEELRKLLEGLE